MRILAWFIGAIVVILTAFMMLTAGWERPPIDAEQTGFRGTGMVDVSNPRTSQRRLEEQLNQVPTSSPAPPDTGGPTAADIYQNVPLLGHLSVAEFNHVMQAITEWVSPEQGCGYCHQLDNLASDAVYTKVVSRRMIEMTQTINESWDAHVGETGVTCYTCHRGENVPVYAWFNADPEIYTGSGILGWRAGQNRASPMVGLTSLPEDPFSDLLEAGEQIRVTGRSVLPPRGVIGSSIQDTEKTFALMIHMSSALDVNCTYCHNTRDFGSWDHSPVQRLISWHGIQMTQVLNTEYVSPLSTVLPPERVGPTGEGHKINCETCHQGIHKPLGGLSMTENYPSLLRSVNGSNGASAMLTEDDVAAYVSDEVSNDLADELAGEEAGDLADAEDDEDPSGDAEEDEEDSEDETVI